MQELEKILEEIDKATDEYGMVYYINDEPVISKKIKQRRSYQVHE